MLLLGSVDSVKLRNYKPFNGPINRSSAQQIFLSLQDNREILVASVVNGAPEAYLYGCQTHRDILSVLTDYQNSVISWYTTQIPL